MHLPMVTAAAPIRVFVHLARGFGARQWSAKWQRGEIVGLNDRLPYGYFWAAEDGCAIEYSEDKKEGALGKLLRFSVRLVLGFDFVHAWRNRRGILNTEVVWTHTESQHLAVLLLFRLVAPAQRPKLVAQSIWLFDRWQSLSPLRRRFYAWLMRQADVLTVHSPENLKLARQLFPMSRSEMVPFGIPGEWRHQRMQRAARHPVRLLALGNDRHRDWASLVGAVRGREDCVLRLVSSRVPPGLIRDLANIQVTRPTSNDELRRLYDWADIVIVPLRPNLHASGITVVQEATLYGLPVICTDTGGLRAYFSDDEVCFVPPQQPYAIRDRVISLAGDDERRKALVDRARGRLVSHGFTSRRYAQRHAELSHELLGQARSSRSAASPDAASGRCGFHYALPVKIAPAALLAVLVAVTAASQLGAPAAEPQAVLDLCAFRPTFREDFNTLSVSPWGEGGTRWIAHTPWHGDFGEAAFANPRPGFPFRVRDGVLDIEARKGADGKWQSGLLASAAPSTAGFAQRYGYFEMRAQLPPGPGTWPGFWLNANQAPGSTEPGVEVDILEYYGQFTDGYHSVVHVWDKEDAARSRANDHITRVPAGSLTSGFHTYGAEVAKDGITFYLDRRATWSTPTPPEMRDPSMVLVNLALGSGWPIDKTPNPSIMQVDYIHVYERRPPTEAAACSPGTGTTARPPQP